MLDWNPALYRRYEDERTRPAQELLARVPHPAPRHVVDLGCGPGNSTELLVQRYPQAQVTGIDNSQAMIENAQERLPGTAFALGDIARWEPAPGAAPDLIYANASLQWVGGHEQLIPRLFDCLAPGGVLAIQMPDNRQEPTHRLMREVAADPRWSGAIGDPNAVRTELLGFGSYYDLLAPRAAHLDVWHTVYQHVMPSAAAIVEWVRATGLKPFIDPLAESQRSAFLAEYERRVESAYAVHTDGRRLLAFPRLFIVAQRSA